MLDKNDLYAPASFYEASQAERDAVCNGCGPGGIGGWLVPDSIWGLRVTAACRIHDWMYHVGRDIEDKRRADQTFLNNLVRLISRHGGMFVVPRLIRASFMFWAVDRFGGPFFWMGKNG